MLPDYIRISEADLGKGSPVQVRVLGDMKSVARDLAETILAEIVRGNDSRHGATLIVPVGPVDHFPLLAGLINTRKISCRTTAFINMDEYLDERGEWIAETHPLSFRGYMNRNFYGLLDADLAPLLAHRLFPHPGQLHSLEAFIAARGGVDACFGGIGINGHLAFNEPPEPGQEITNSEFAGLPSRALPLSRETRAINSVTVGGELSIIPKSAVTVGMKEILAARRLRFYCNRPWQSAVVRRGLHGPLTAACPASFLRTHPDAVLTIADYVAQPPDIRLR